MKTLNYNEKRIKIEKEFAWLITTSLLISSFPALKKAICISGDSGHEKR
jgi:hypothetical protein